MRFGLKEETLSKINALFANFPEVEEAILYGSRAKGNYKPGSDIDLTLKGENLTSVVLDKISGEIDDLLLPYTLDISIFTQIDNPELIDHIQRVGKVFYKKENDVSKQ